MTSVRVCRRMVNLAKALYRYTALSSLGDFGVEVFFIFRGIDDCSYEESYFRCCEVSMEGGKSM